MPHISAKGKGDYLKEALGAAVVDCWASLPQEIQRQIFEAAVSGASADVGDDVLREELALFLHDHHPRTDHPESMPGNRGDSKSD